MLENLVLPPTNTLLLYCLLGLGAMVEGPIATLAGGAAASSGLLLPLPAYLSIVLGNLTADMGWYALGRFSSAEWLTRIIHKFGVDTRRIDQVRQNIQRHAPRLVFLCKMTVGFPIPTLVATGLSRVPVRRWAASLVAGELIKSAVLVTIGYLFARAIFEAAEGVQTVLWSITALILISAFLWFKRRKRISPGRSREV